MGRSNGTVVYHTITHDVHVTDYDFRLFQCWLTGRITNNQISLKQYPYLSEEDAGLVMKYLREELKVIPEEDGESFQIEDIEIESVNQFYEFLQGTNYGSELSYKLECGGISSEAAFGIIYYLQEVLEVLPDKIERCDACECLYDSYCEGTTINEDSEYHNIITGRYEKFDESDYGRYCDDCRPD